MGSKKLQPHKPAPPLTTPWGGSLRAFVGRWGVNCQEASGMEAPQGLAPV